VAEPPQLLLEFCLDTFAGTLFSGCLIAIVANAKAWIELVQILYIKGWSYPLATSKIVIKYLLKLLRGREEKEYK
jgi:hypothetical protein